MDMGGAENIIDPLNCDLYENQYFAKQSLSNISSR